ncbi:MAG: hypothetical protein IJ891_08405 [Prevotella sp.]|nr:hypothetical protein [Prevotella sp.]
MEENVIKLESSYFDADSFKLTIKAIESMFVELLCNAADDYEADAKKIGSIFFWLDMIEKHEIVDTIREQ